MIFFLSYVRPDLNQNIKYLFNKLFSVLLKQTNKNVIIIIVLFLFTQH